MSKQENEIEKQSEDAYWWKEGPQDEPVRVLVEAKIPDVSGLLVTDEEKRIMRRFFRTQAVEEVMDFIQYNPELFAGINEQPVIAMGALGFIGMTITPGQCDELMKSELVEEISKDEILNLEWI